MVLVVLRILNTCALDFCVVSGLINVRSWHLMWFLICGLVQVLFLSLVVIFNILVAIFLLRLLD